MIFRYRGLLVQLDGMVADRRNIFYCGTVEVMSNDKKVRGALLYGRWQIFVEKKMHKQVNWMLAYVYQHLVS